VKHLDLFSGIGGFALAAGWAGVETVAFAEVDAYASGVLAKNFPRVPNLGDVRLLTRHQFPYDYPDLITAGFPCQPFSKIGKRQAEDDARDLWPETRRILQDFRPAWFIGENVAGIVTLALDRVCNDLEEDGYAVQPLLIPAGAVGARHRRERVWILAHRIGEGLEGHPRHEPITATGRQEPHGPACQSRLRPRLDPWVTEPDVDRVANGIPRRVDRIKALGNAIVPQVAYQLIVSIKQLQLHDSSRPLQSQEIL